MTKPKKRSKKYVPKYVARNVLSTVFGGMSGTHRDHLLVIQTRNHRAVVEMTQGRGTRDDWDRIVGSINIANVMCEQGIGDEFRQATIAARDALLAVGTRYMAGGRFVFKGGELRAVNEGLACHDAQLENIRAIDVDRAAMEVARRVRHGINSTNVQREMAREAA